MPILNKDKLIPAVEWTKEIKPLIDEGYSLSITPQGLSMVPFIVGGRDSVLLKSKTDIKLKRGDIVLYPNPDNECVVLHRIHHIKDNKYCMLGDALTFIERPIDYDNIIAVVYEIKRKGKIINCDNKKYMFLVKIWLFIRPFRPFIFFIRKIFRFIKRSLRDIFPLS